MKILIIFAVLSTLAMVQGETRRLDYSLQELVTSNDKLREIHIQHKKLEDFILRWGYFYGYLIDEILWMNNKFGTTHDHAKTHAGNMIIDTECVTKLETFNGYLDYIVNTDTMDAIV